MEKIKEIKIHLAAIDKIIADIEGKNSYDDIDKHKLMDQVKNVQDIIDRLDRIVTYT